MTTETWSIKDVADTFERHGLITEQEPSDDLISRQEVLEQINCWIGSGEYRYTNATYYLTERVKHISSVKQEQKTGHWIFYGRLLKCSNCGYINDDILDECPNCKISMVDPQESEDKGSIPWTTIHEAQSVQNKM